MQLFNFHSAGAVCIGTELGSCRDIVVKLIVQLQTVRSHWFEDKTRLDGCSQVLPEHLRTASVADGRASPTYTSRLL